ncbi:MAG TPA: phosphatidylserine decarboxylase [Phycisphaerales bacterium]|nr:phosphatidylserine decarboxylase [Phycisphaerales bacterium]
MLLTPYGLREWLAITIVCVLLAALVAWLGWWWLVVPVAVIWFAGVAFFRDPIRSVPAGLAPGAMLAPADGLVKAVTHVEHHDATGGPAVVLRIFLSVLDVHINRSPIDGEVVSVTHTPGRYLDARKEESAKVNESNLVVLRISTGETIGVRQVSGAIARRIVCPIVPGDRLKRGERFGMIKFGSTTELILPRPRDVAVHIKPGDKVRGGKTLMATLAM